MLRVAREYLRPDRLVVLVVGDTSTIEDGDPEHPEYSIEALSAGPVTRIPLPDPFTLVYPDPPPQ